MSLHLYLFALDSLNAVWKQAGLLPSSGLCTRRTTRCVSAVSHAPDLDCDRADSVPTSLAYQTPLSRIPNAEPSSLSVTLQTFESYLTTLDVLSSPRLSLLSSPALGRAIHRNALERLGGAYAELWEAVMDKEANKYEFPLSLLIRGKEEVRVLLGVDESRAQDGRLADGR